MVTRKKTARKRRSTRRTATKRGARRTGRTRQPDLGPNLRRLIQGKVLSAGCYRNLSAMSLNRIEDLSGREVGTLIAVRKQVGPMPGNCCLI
jgi:hypothetical protein